MTAGGMKIAVLGGTGKEGSGLAIRWANAGHQIILGSRDAERAGEVAASINEKLGKAMVSGADNKTAASQADLVVLAVPFSAQQATALDVQDALAGKVLVDVTVPLVPPKVSRVQLPNGGSAVEALQHALGDGVKVVSAFQNVSAHHLSDLDFEMECDVLVCGDDGEAVETVIGLARDAGMAAYAAGPLANSVVAEGLTSVLIAINRKYKVPAAGIRITGLGDNAS